MSYPIPTLSQIRSNIEADFNSRLKGADSRLWANVLRVLSFAMATVAWGIYTFQAYVSRQHLPDTADDEQLDRLGGLDGVDRKGATYAAGTATVAGADPAPIGARTTLQTSDHVAFVVQADTAIAGGTATLTLKAAVAGSAGNLAPGTQLSFIAPVAGVAAVATVVTMDGGIDDEDDDWYRGRIVDHRRRPPQGGTLADYEAWVKDNVAGATRAWARPSWVGAGTVGVLFVFDGRGDIYPTADDLAAVQTLLNRKAPSTDIPYAVAPIANPMDLTIAINPSSDAIKAAIAAELADLVVREGEPGITTLLTHIQEAVKLGVGDGDYRLSVPNANFTNTAAQITTLGNIAWAAW
jgi:uncharacterized phage protein gp47/JayE